MRYDILVFCRVCLAGYIAVPRFDWWGAPPILVLVCFPISLCFKGVTLLRLSEVVFVVLVHLHLGSVIHIFYE